jgi:hypothetical protein
MFHNLTRQAFTVICGTILLVHLSSVGGAAEGDANGLTPVSVGGKFGFADASGSVVVEPRYDDVNVFREGVAAVRRGRQWGLVDGNGTEVVPPKFDELLDESSEGLIPVASAGKWMYIDRRGVSAFSGTYQGAGGFSEGRAAVQLNGRWGYIDRAGGLVIAPTFDAARPFSEGLAAVAIKGKFGYIDASGAVKITPQYAWAGLFSSGLAAVRQDSKIGFIDPAGVAVVPFKFEECSMGGFIEGVCAARSMGKWGLIDARGDWVVKPAYDKLGDCVAGAVWGEKDGRDVSLKLADALRKRNEGRHAATRPATTSGDD